MAKLTFTQGIVRHGKSPGQSFFLQQNGTYVDLVVSPDSTIIAFADGTKDYLFTESVSLNQLWGPFNIPTQANWLYWDINKVTGVRTFGSTTLEPLYGDIAQPLPLVGQMWFDTRSSAASLTGMKMLEWNGASWVPVLRVIAAKYLGNQFLSPVNNLTVEDNFTGTQIGIVGVGAYDIGSLAFDASGKPIVNQDGKFFTTEDVFTTGVPTGASLKVNNILLRAQALTTIAAFTVVTFDSFSRINNASPFDFIDKIYGIIEEDVPTNGTTNVLMEGIIYNQQWDFTDTVNNPNMSGGINDPLYITSTGTLTTNINISIPGQVPIGVIIGIQSILFRPGVYGSSGFGVGNDHGNLTGLADDDHAQYFNATRGDVQYYPRTIADLVFSPIVHTHTRSDISDFAHLHVEADIQDLQDYMVRGTDDTGFVSIGGDTMTGPLLLTGNTGNPLEAVTKQYADAIAAGIDAKESVAVGTTFDIAGTYVATDGSGGTGEFTGVDINNLDGSLSGSDYTFDLTTRVLVKNQIDPKQNGLYIVTDMINPALATLERAPDHDGTPTEEVSPGNYTFINGGVTQAGSGWVILAGDTFFNDIITLNTDDMNWSAVSSSTAYTADETTITIDGNLSNQIQAIPASGGGTIDALQWNSQNSTINAPIADHVLVYDSATFDWKNRFPTLLSNAALTSTISIDTGGAAADGNIDINAQGRVEIRSSLGVDVNLWSGNNMLHNTSASYQVIGSSLNFRAGASLSAPYSSIAMSSNPSNPQITMTADTLQLRADDSFNLSTSIVFVTPGNSNDVTFTAQTPSGVPVLFSLPNTEGTAGDVLSTDGFGLTSWIAASGGGGGNSLCLQDTDGDTFVSVGYLNTACTDSTNNLIRLQTGNSNPAGSVQGGDIELKCGVGAGGARSGSILLQAGYGYAPSNQAGGIDIVGGQGDGVFAGTVDIRGGWGYNGGARGGNVNLTAGSGPTTGPNNSGNVTISAGGFVAGGFGGDPSYRTGSVSIQTQAYAKYSSGNIYLEPANSENGSDGGYGDTQGHIIIRKSSPTNGYYTTPVELRFESQYGNNFTGFRSPRNGSNDNSVIELPRDAATGNGQVMLVTNTTRFGTDAKTVISTEWSSIPYDLFAQGFGPLADGDLLLRFIAPRPFIINGVSTGRIGFAGTPPAADTTFDLRLVNGAGSNVVGVFTVLTGDSSVTWAATAGDISINQGDLFSIQLVAANGIGDVSITIAGRS